MSPSISERLAQIDDSAPRKSTLEQLFWEQPVPLDVFVQDRKYLANPPLSLEQYRLVQHIERVYLPETFVLMGEEWGGYWAEYIRMCNNIVAQWGKGGGKDHTVRVASLRVTYMLLCMKSPQKYFSMPEQDSIHLLNIAANAGQANRAFFKPMTEAVKRGWFKDFADPKRDTIEYDKHIEAVSGHSEAEGQEGLNIMLGVADEIDAFKARDEMVGQGKKAREASTSAESILEMLKTSASTRFPDSYKRVAISFPRYLGSTIQRLTAEGRADNELMGEHSRDYVSGPLATWDVNPRVKGKHQFEADYRLDPAAAAAKYECKPSRSSDAYFRNPQLFKDAVVRESQPLTITYRVASVHSKESGQTTKVWEPVFNFAPDLKPVDGALYAIHADLALRGDRAGIAMSHVRRWEERTDTILDEDGAIAGESEYLAPVVANDFTVAFAADSSARDEEGRIMPREIQIRWARLLCFELLKRGFVIKRFTFDNFQSADSMQILNRHGIETERVSTDINDNVWKTVMDVSSDSRLEMPYNDILQIELEALTRLSNGKVDHPPGGCFVGETRIPLLDGTFPQISELAGQQVWVYSATPEGKIVPGLARGRMTKSTTDLVDVVLDNGYVARCTPEHLWMLRDGSYREAQSLRPSIDRLMPITFNWPVNGGYVRVTDKDGLRTLGHHMVAEHFEGRTREPHEVVHHDNENKTDNRPENLKMITQVDHTTHHGNDYWAGKESAMRAGHAEWAADPERKAAAYKNRKLPRFRDDITVDAILGAIREGAQNRAEAARLLGCDWNVVEGRLKAERTTFPDLLELVDNNHKVRAVIPVTLEEPVPVYDLEVDEWSNFALSGGVFVHNSKDLADAFGGSIAGAIVVGGGEDANGNSIEGSEQLFEMGSYNEPFVGGEAGLPGGAFGMPLGMRGFGDGNW